MALKVSTGLRDYMLATGSLKAAMALGFVDIYLGTAPASADEAIISGNQLVRISLNSTATGLSLDTAAASGVISKAPLETWSGVCTASGVAAFYRLVGAADTGVLSTTEPRIQGTIGLAGADLNMTNTSLVMNAAQTIDAFALALPSL